MFLSVYVAVLCLPALAVASEDCANAPIWLFSLPDDLSTIYEGLTGTFLQLYGTNSRS